LIQVGEAKTVHNTVTLLACESEHKHLLFSGEDGGSLDVFQIEPDGALNALGSWELYDQKGPARGLVASKISDKELLFVGNKGGNVIEVFEIRCDGSLRRVHIEHDSNETHLGVVITLHIVHMRDASFLFAGGLEDDPGLSCFEVLPDGSLQHVQSMKDNDDIFTDGIIGMYSHKINGQTYLITGGFQDNGISSFRVFKSGHFENTDNFGDNTTDRYLTGTYPVNGITLDGRYWIVVGHRHHKYYKRLNFIKKKDFVYHGDGVSVFEVNADGKLLPRSVLKDDETTLLAGQTRIEMLPMNPHEAAVVVGTRDDDSLQLCTLNADGVLAPTGVIETGYPIYYGVALLRIGESLFFFAGSVDPSLKTVYSYRFKI